MPITDSHAQDLLALWGHNVSPEDAKLMLEDYLIYGSCMSYQDKRVAPSDWVKVPDA